MIMKEHTHFREDGIITEMGWQSHMYIITIMAAQDMFTVMYTVQKKRRR